MTTFFNKLFGKNKEEATLPLEPHAARYMFDFSTMPSVPAYGTSCIFGDGEVNHETFYDSFLKEVKDIPSLTSSVKVRTYKIKEGKLAVFTFPDPEASPEVKYGICVFNVAEAERLNRNPYEHPNPYYILAKIVDVWAIGEIKPHPQQSNEYVTTYYKTMNAPNLRQFVKWVMDREELSPVDPVETYPDVIERECDISIMR